MTETGPSGQTPVVVVGVDGSAGAREALRWAVAEARLRKTGVRAVHGWTFGFSSAPGAEYGYLGGAPGLFTADGLSDVRRVAEEVLDRAIAEVGTDSEGVEIERQVVEGGAAEVLVAAVCERDLLVVGSRGHGGFAALLLGSISQQCAHHAPCPVVIVHPSRPVTAESASVAAADVESPTPWPHSHQEAEVEDVVSALREYRTLTRARLVEVCGARHWSDPGFRRALEEAVSTGRVRRVGGELYEIVETSS